MNIVFTGGGTAGHAMVNMVLAKQLSQNKNHKLLYIGSHSGAERALMAPLTGVTYFPIATGKLRRYFSLENGKDFFRVWKGIAEAYQILKRQEANVVCSGGGFVSLPVVLAARLLGIPVLIRETDMTIGLANRICMPFAQKIITTFPDTLVYLQGLPCVHGGLIVRPELLEPEATHRPTHKLPRVLIIGGSLGSQVVNRTIWEGLKQLSEQFQIIHLCGRGQQSPSASSPNYQQLDYCHDMAALYAKADVVVMRCGSNAISEGLALGKRMVCIPISGRFSRGEQLDNARYARRHGCAVLLEEQQLDPQALAEAIAKVLQMPIKKDSILSEADLAENCHQLIEEIYMAAAQNWEQRMIAKLKTNQVDWKALSPFEFRLCAQLAEEYGG